MICILLFNVQICNNYKKKVNISEYSSNFEKKKIFLKKNSKNNKYYQINKYNKFAIFLCFLALIFIRFSWDMKLKFGDFSTKNNPTENINMKRENDGYGKSDNKISVNIIDNNNNNNNDKIGRAHV